MCGISGVLNANGSVARAAVERMNAAQAHRGPDDFGIESIEVSGRSLVLGHRRLAIIDLSASGHQPMSNPDTGDLIVYNGEIYNFSAIRTDLQAHGERFRSHSDTEVVLRAFGRWGIDCVRRFDGMFAFALFCERERRLYLARDPLGIKPLYYCAHGDGLVFASEVRAVSASGLVSGDVDRRALASAFAYGAVPAPLTILDGVRALEPGSIVACDLTSRFTDAASVRSTRYWEFPERHASRAPTSRIAEELGPVLRSAVESHLISDVPVGIFLSRGLDSTAIAALASELRGGDVDTFTVSLADDQAIDEGPAAAMTARALGTRHHNVVVGEAELQSMTLRWLNSVDQPTVDGLNTYVVSRAVRDQGIVVALSGLGGDEMFGGYSTFSEAPALLRLSRSFRFLPRNVRQQAVARLLAHRTSSRAQKAVELAGTDATLRSIYFRRRRLLSDREMQGLGFTDDEADAFIPAESESSRWLDPNDDWASIRTLETRFYMGNMLLRDADVFGMAHGLEIRVPLLDRRVVELALRHSRFPFNWRGGTRKRWLAAAMAKKIPRDVSALPKRGFSLPHARWMAGPLRDEFKSRLGIVAGSGMVDRRGVDAIWASFLADQRGPSWSRAWMLGVVGGWLARSRA